MLRIDTVLNLLTYGIALLGYVPLFPYLEQPPRLLFPLALAGGLLADRLRYRPPAWLPTLFSILFFLYYASRFSRENLVVPAVNLLVILMAVRLIGEKNSRTCLQIFALALFSFTSSSLFNLSPVFVLYLGMILVLIAVTLVILTFRDTAADPYVTPRDVKKILAVSLTMPVAAVPLMLLLFVIMPRTQFPLWEFLNVGGSRVTGFSEKVEPGSASAVGESRDVAFRVHCENLPKERLYWRAIVINTPTGSAWVRSEPPGREPNGIPKGGSIRQTIYPEPGRMTHPVALNIPWSMSGLRMDRDEDHTFTFKGKGAGRIRYEAISVPEVIRTELKDAGRSFYLRVPPDVSPQMREQAELISRKGRNDGERVALLEDYFAVRNLTYATTGLPTGRHPLDEFLFEKRRGNCEFFATTFATLLRLSGVPARLVGGYYGGEYNGVGGYYVVTEGMAHVWVEAYIGGTGWVTVDPSRWAANFRGNVETGRMSMVRRLAMAADTFSYYWNMAVINYDLERQFRLISSANAGLKKLSVGSAVRGLLIPAAVAALAVAAIGLAGRWRRSSREERILARFHRQVRKTYGREILPDMGLLELAASLDDPAARRFAALYGNAVYHDRRLLPEELLELERLIGSLSVPDRAGPPGRSGDGGNGTVSPHDGVNKP